MKRPHTFSSRRSFLGGVGAVAAAAVSPRLLNGEDFPPAPEPASILDLPASAPVQPTEAFARWSPKKGPLMTRWSSRVDPRLPHPHYPRPQLVRKEWLNLNGVWEYQPGTDRDITLGQPDPRFHHPGSLPRRVRALRRYGAPRSPLVSPHFHRPPGMDR